MTINIADRLELHELPGRYGDAIDDRNWDRLREIFTDDAVFDLADPLTRERSINTDKPSGVDVYVPLGSLGGKFNQDFLSFS